MVYVNPAGFPTPGLPNAGYKVWIALVVMIISAGFVVIARVATRIVAAQVGADDWAIVTSLGFFLVQTILWALSVRAGYGADYTLLADWQRFLFNKWWFIGSIFWLCTIAMYKTSCLLLLNRIFVQKGFKRVCWALLLINSCWAVGNVLGWIFQCLPIPVMWGQAPVGANIRCFNQNALWISIVTWDVASDVAILLLPQPMVWKLNLKRREKAMLTGMFLLGAIVVLFSLLSCGAIVSKLPDTSSDKNQYTFALANLFQVLESGFGIIGSCLPIMRQPLKHLFPKLIGSSNRRNRHYYDDEGKSDQYVMHNLSNGQKSGAQAAWNSVSVSGPDMFKSSQRKSDELGIIEDPGDMKDGESGTDMDGHTDSFRHVIKKETEYSINRF